MANSFDDEENGSGIYGNAEEIAKSGSETAKETLKEELAPESKNIVETTPAETTPVEPTSKETALSAPVKRTYDAKEMRSMFANGERYSQEELDAMSEKQYGTFQNELAKYYDTHDTLGGQEVESKRGKALTREAEEIGQQAKFIEEESADNPEYAEYNAKYKKIGDFFRNDKEKWKDLTEEERDVIRNDVRSAYDYAEKQRGHARVFWDALQRGVGGVPTMMYQGVQTVFGSDDATDKIRESQREQELEDILNPKRSSSYSNIKSAGDLFNWALEGVGENVPRMIPGIAASVAGGAIASAATLNPVAGVMVGGALGGMFLNIGEGAQDQLAEEDLNRQYGNGSFDVSRGAAAVQGIGYSVMEGALGVVPGFGKVISGAFGRLAAKEAAKGFVKEATETGAKATLKGLGKELAKNAIEEGVEEVSQSGIVAPIRRLFQTGSALKDGQRFYGQDPVSGIESFLHEELDEFLGGAVVGGLIGGASSAVDTADARKRVNAHSYVARLGGVLDGDPEFAKFDNKSKMLVGRMIFNDAMQTTTNLISQDRKNELNAENGEINAELRRMAESGTDAEKLQAQAVSAYVNMLEGRFALEDYAKVVEEAKGLGITSDAFAKGREVSTTTVSVGDKGDYAEVSKDVESGVQKWHLFDKDGKELGWATGNASDRKAPIIDAKDLVLKTEEEADEQARNTDIFNQYRTGKNGPKTAAIRSIFEKMYGNRGIELEVVDRLDPIGANMRVGKNPAMFTPNGMKVYVAADQVKSLGQLYTLLGHEKLHADIADYILKAARVSGANGIFTNTKKGKSYQIIKADGAVDINALNAAQDEMLANTLGAEEMTQMAREKNPKSDWAISEGRTGQEMMAERKSVEDLRMQLLRGNRGVFGSVLEKVQRAIGMKMALDMGISAESITANDVMDEVREITRRGYLGIPKENSATEKTESVAKAETAEAEAGTQTETTTEKKDTSESVIQPTGAETFNPGHVVRRSDGELFTRTSDGKWEGSDGSVVDDASALNGGYQNVKEGVAPKETTEEEPKADAKTEAETDEKPVETPVETAEEKKETAPVAENAPKTTIEASEEAKTDNVPSKEAKASEAVPVAPETKAEYKTAKEEKTPVADTPKKEEPKQEKPANKKTGNLGLTEKAAEKKEEEKKAVKKDAKKTEEKPAEKTPVKSETATAPEVKEGVLTGVTQPQETKTEKSEVKEDKKTAPVEEKKEIKSVDGELKIGVQKKVVEAVRNNPYVVQEQKNAGVRLTERQLASIAETVGDNGEIVDVQIGENDGVKDVVFFELKDGTLKMFDKEGVEIADEEDETRKKSSEDLINASDEEWKAASIGARFKSIADMLAMPPELDFIRSKKKSEQKGYEGLTRDAVLAKAVTDENAKFALLSDYADDLVGLFKDEGLDENEQDKAFGYILKQLDAEIGKDRVLAKMQEQAFDAESAKGLTKEQRKNRIEAFKRDLKERLKEHFRSVEAKNDPRRQIVGDEVVSTYQKPETKTWTTDIPEASKKRFSDLGIALPDGQDVTVTENGKVRTTKSFWYDKANDILRTERVEVPAETKLVITHDAEKRLAEHKKAIAEFDARIERMVEKALANFERHNDIVKSVGESHTSKPRTKPSKFGLLGNAITADALIKTIARQVVDGMIIAKVVANENAQAEKKAKLIKRFKRANMGYVNELRDGFIITDEDREQANTTAGQILLAKMAVNNSDIESRDIARAIILDELVYKKVRDADVSSRVAEILLGQFESNPSLFAEFSDKTKFVDQNEVTESDDTKKREDDFETDETEKRKSSDSKPLTAYIRNIEKRAKSEVERGKISNSSGNVVSLDQKVGGKKDEDGIELSGYLNLYDESGSAADDIIGSYGGDPGINLDRIERGLYVDEDSYNKAVDRLGRIKSSISRSNANLIDAYLGYVNDRIANAKAIVDEMETAAREDKGRSRYLTENVKTVSDKIGFKKTMLYLKRRLHALYTMRINDDEIVNAIAEKTGTPKGFIKARINNLLANLRIAFDGRKGRFSVEQRQDAKESLKVESLMATGIRYYSLKGILFAMSDAGYDEMAAVVRQTEEHLDETSEDIAKRVKRMNIQTVSYSKNGRLVKKVVGQDGVYDGRRVSKVKEDAFRLFGWIDPRARDITTYRNVAKTRDEDSTRIYLESAGWKKERIDAAKKSYEESKKFAEDRQEKRDKENTKRELVNLISARIRELADTNNGDYSAIYSEYPMQETYSAVSRYERGLVEARKRKLESERKQRLEEAKNEEERQRLLAEIAKEKEANPELERQFSFFELQDMVREYFANKPENEFASGEIFTSAENHLVDEMIRRDPILAFGESDYRDISDVKNAVEKIEKSDEQNRRDNALNSIKTAAALAVRSVREEKLREFSKNKDSLRSQYPNQNRVQEAKKKAEAEKSLAGAMKIVDDARRMVEKSRPTKKDILGNKIKGEPTLNKYGLTAKQQEKIDSYSRFADGIKKDADLVKAFKENLPKGLSEKAIQDQINAYKTYRMIKDAFDLVEAKEAEDAARNEALAKEKAEKEKKAVVDGARKKSTEDVVIPQVSQAVSSAGTSLPQNDPTLYKSKKFISSLKRGNKNFDIGAGLTMKPTNRMAEFGVENVKFDPFNVPAEQNSRAINLITSGTKFPTITCANVLNVIAERDSRRNVILQTAKAVSNDGTVFFDVYTAPKEGLTKKGTYQTAMRPEEYLSEIEPFFNNVERHGSIIVASSPKTDVVNRYVASWWNKEPGTEGFNEIRYKSTDESFTDDRTIVSPEDTRYMAGQKASLDAHGLGLDYEKIVKKDPILREEAEVIVRDSQKILSTIQKAIEGKAMKDGEILAMVYALADTKANVLLERDASLHVAPAVMSEILKGKDCEQFMDIVAEGIRMAGNRAGASLRALQLAIAASGIRDTKAYMLGKIKERMAKEGITGEVNPGLVKKVEELEKQLADERKKVEDQKNLIEKLEKEAAEADAKAEVKYETEYAKKLADAKAEAEKRAKDEYERGLKDGCGKPFTRSAATYKALGLKTDGFDLDGAASAIVRNLGLRHAGNPDISLNEELRAAFDEFYAASGNDINATRKAVNNLFKGLADAAFDVYADEMASKIAKAKSKDGTNKGRKTTVDDNIEKERKVRKAKASKRIKAEDLKAISDYNEYLAKLANAHADNAIRAIGEKASSSERREALGEALRAFYKMAILKKPDVKFDDIIKQIVAEGQRIIRAEITPVMSAEESAKIDASAAAFGREDAVNAVRGSDGYSVKTRQSALTDREMLLKALSLAKQNKFTEAAEVLGLRYMDDAKIVDTLIAQAVRDMNRIGGVLASQFGGKQDEDLIRKFDELRTIVRELKSPELTTEQKIGKYISLASNLKRYHRQRTLVEDLQIRIDRLNRKLEMNDFERKPKQTKPMLDAERAHCAALQVEYKRLQQKCKNAQEQLDLRNASGVFKLIKGVSSVLLDMKGVVGSLDLSSSLRQGGQMSWSHPLLFVKNLKKTIEALKDENVARNMMLEIYKNPLFKYMERAGVYFADWGDMAMNGNEEEMIMLRHYRQITRFKLAKMGIDSTERAFAMFLNLMRADVFEKLVGYAGIEKLEDVTDQQWRALGKFVNVGSQRGDVEGAGSFEKALRSAIPAANYFMWSPRNFISRLQFLKETLLMPLAFVKYKGNAVYDSYGDSTMKRAFAIETVRYLAGVATMIGFCRLLANLFRDDEEPPPEIVMDPRSSDFMKVKIGNTRLDFLSGLQQIMVLSSRALTKQKTNLRGQTHEIYNTYDLMGRFARSKMSPGIGMMYDLLVSKETFDRQDISWKLYDQLTSDKEKIGGFRYISQSTMVPLIISDIIEQAKNTGIPETTFTGLLTMLGAGVQAFDPYTYKQMKEDFRYFKRAYSEITDPQAQKDFIVRHPMLKRAGSIEAQIKNINRIEKDIKRLEKAGGKPGDWMLDNLEREKKRAINLMAGFKNPFDTGE